MVTLCVCLAYENKRFTEKGVVFAFRVFEYWIVIETTQIGVVIS